MTASRLAIDAVALRGLSSMVAAVLSCACGTDTTGPARNLPATSSAAVTSMVTLINEDFEASPLGFVPSPLFTFQGCGSTTIGVSDDVAQSGSRSLKHDNPCFAPFAAGITFKNCSRWPTAAEWTLYRRQESYTYTAFSMHALLEEKEPGTSIQLGPDGNIRVSDDGVAPPNTVIGSYTIGVWTKFRTVWNFREGTYDVFLNEAYAGTFPTRIRHAWWADHGSNTPVLFYDDNIRIDVELLGERQNCEP